jgi:predicted HicB family RNase H-like nuclease
MLRVPPDVHAAAAAAAEASGNSLNQWAAKALSAAAEEQRAA